MTPYRRPARRRRSTTGRTGGTRAWAKASKEFAAGKTCWLRLPGCTIRAIGIDHYYPVKTHPHLEWIMSNWRPACLHCNLARRETPVHDLPKLRLKMERDPKYRLVPVPRALRFFG